MTIRLSLALALVLGWAGIAHANSSDFSPNTQDQLIDARSVLACGGSDGDKKNPP